jgi:hypothetical protein
MSGTSYNTENIILKARVLNTAKYAPGTYRKGQLLGRISASGVFTAYDAEVTTGAEKVAAVCPVDVTITAALPSAPAARGEFSRRGVAEVMASLTNPVTLDDKLIGQCWDAGIILN